jgi:pilus assembly protein CpaB
LKRSNRLILLIGLFLAAIAFVGIILVLGQGSGTTPGNDAATKTTYTVAAADIPLGTLVTAEMIETRDVKIEEKPLEAFTLASDAIGRTTTTEVLKGQNIGPQTFSATTVNPDIARLLDTGRRAMSIQVDQVSGVGTLIKPGDRVDVVVGISGSDKFPVVATDPQTKQVTLVPGINATSVKAIIQNLEVVGTLLPPPPAQEGTTNGGTGGTGGTAAPTLNGQTQIVILSVSAQEAEVLRFGQIDGTITIVLRSPDDKDAPNDETTGITLRQLVDKWAVIPPQVVETVLPKK